MRAGFRLIRIVLGFSASMFLAGCHVWPKRAETFVPITMTARYTAQPVCVDGLLNDDVWKTAEVYPLYLGKDRAAEGNQPAEPGEVRLAWDDKYFYVGIKYYDSDIVAEGDEDQLHHYNLGDLVELFLKPEEETWYWELYATPKGKKTSFWFPGRGRTGLPSGWKYRCGLRVAAKCAGTLNDWRDKDEYWMAEMAMPISDLTARGESFRPGAKWRILVARYNYTRYLPAKELSMTPQLTKTSYHRCEEYAVLDLAK